MVVWSTSACFVVEGTTCARSSENQMLSCSPSWQHLPFFWSFSNLDRTTDKPSRYLSENPISLKQGTSLFPSKRGLVKMSVNCS